MRLSLTAAFAAAVVLSAATARAHCDTIDGPVVKAAQAALESGKVARVLRWVPERDEAEVRKAFDDTRAVRALGPAARDLADRYFFETVVRVHRAGEGMAYEGLKPAGALASAAIAAADEALADRSLDPVLRRLTADVQHALHKAYLAAIEAADRAGVDDVTAGREAVAAYVRFIHLVESLAGAAGGGAAHPR